MKLNFKPELSYSDKKKRLKLPTEMTEELAEFLGILAGDGCINKYIRKKGNKTEVQHYISITGSFSDDNEYFRKHLIPIFKKLFNLDLKSFKLKGQDTIRICVNSKGLFIFLKNIGMNIGPKNNIKILDMILDNDEFLIPFIRGFFDTDCSIALKSYNHNYPVISVKQKSRRIIEQLKTALDWFGFPMYVEYDVITTDPRGFSSKGSRIYIYGRKNLKRWVEIIGFNNLKHLKKIEKAMGQVGVSPTVK